jgi:hypothetical protein
MAAKRQTKEKPAAAPVAIRAAVEEEPDPLRARMYNMTDEQRAKLRVRLVDLITKSLADMSAVGVQDVAQFVYIEKGARGFITPAEEFIVGLVRHHYVRALTPEDVVQDVDNFRDDFDTDIDVARRFNSMYPELVAAKTETQGARD